MLITVQTLVALGQSGQADSRHRFEPAPSDVSLRIRTVNDQSIFRIGEVIRLALFFTSAAPNKYRVAVSAYLEGGSLEHIAVEPRLGLDDGLNIYLNSCPQFSVYGLENSKVLSPKPTIVVLRLNELVRFNDPGQYQITVESDRVARLNSAAGKGQLSLRSNPLSLSVVPATEQWRQQTLESAVSVLDSPPSAADLPWAELGARKAAAKALRFLGTPAAARAMGRHYQDWANDFLLGLVGSPAREAALNQMKALLVDPYIQVTNQFLCAMSIVALPADTAGDISAQRKAFETHFRDELSSALKNKQGSALAVSAQTVYGER